MRRLAWLLGLAACGRGPSDAPIREQAAPCTAEPEPTSGNATHYDADGRGNCSFDASADRMVAAINRIDYARAATCGACLRVTGPRGEIVVRVVDQCPGCKQGDLDLSREAFALLAPLSSGRIRIAWRPIACEVTGPLAYRFKDGSNPSWTAIQLRNHRYPIAALEARNPRGAFRPIARADYNYFVTPAGLGTGPYTFRITDTRGHTVEDSGIALGDGVTREGTVQLPLCP